MKKTKTDAKELSTMRVFGRLLSLIHGLEGWMVLAILAGVAGFICALGIPVVAMMAAGSVMDGGYAITWNACLIALVLFAILRGALRYGEQACNHYIAFRLLAQIRDIVFGKLRTLGPAKLDGKQKGDLIALITSDVELLEVFYAHTISPVLIASISAIFYIAFGFSIHWIVGLVLLAAYFGVAILVPLLISKSAQEIGTKRRQANGALTSVVLENVHGLDDIIQYGMEKSRKELMEKRTEELCAKERALKKQTILAGNMSLTVVTVFCALMAVVAGTLAVRGIIPWSHAFVALVFQASSFGPFMAVANLSTGLSQTIGAARRVIALLDEEPITPEIEEGETPAFDGMTVKDLSFAYSDNSVPVLENLSLEFPKGTITGIEGKSGFGKSTLLRLLMRFYDPKTGQVLLSDEDLKTVKTTQLRKEQSVVLQDTVLFTDTIANNLKVAKPSATLEEMKEAAKKANIADLIDSLPEGYNTMLAEGGSSLSSGEKQRLGLVRAFLHDADMMLLDEPTSNLDSLNEGAILRSVALESKGRTVVLVSHRKGTLSFADRLIHMEDKNNEHRKEARI